MTLLAAACITGGILLALVLGVVLIGACLPRHHVVTCTRSYREPPLVIWSRIAAPLEGMRWRRGLRAVTAAPPIQGHRSWIESDRHGAIRYVEEESTMPQRRVVRMADDALPFGGRWIMVLQPEGGGTRLAITEEGEVRNPLFRFVSALVIGHTATMRAYLQDLEASFAPR